VWIGKDYVEQEFAKTLREAAWTFVKEKDGRFHGSIYACQAVARFIYRSGGGAELAAPFLQIAEAFIELERGGQPRLFSKKTVPDKQRERSPERKHIQRLAAAALEVLCSLGDEIGTAADRVARYVNDWPGMAAQQITGSTVINWRKQLNRSNNKKLENLVKATLKEPNPRAVVEGLLREGPPGAFR